MSPVDIRPIGGELAIKWDDGSESFVPFKKLRLACPCAGCRGERDIMGNIYQGPDTPLTSRSLEMTRIVNVGNYAVQPVWGDGHNTGVYSFDYLRRVAEAG